MVSRNLLISVEQGLKRDGSIKIRSVDDETSCGTNLCVKPAEKLKCDGIDVLAALASLLHSFGSREFSLWKADVKSAYRRVPVRPDQRWLLWVAILVNDEIIVARHNAMPFGCTGSSQCYVFGVARLHAFALLLSQAAFMLGIE
jgi:hypothetical protein